MNRRERRAHEAMMRNPDFQAGVDAAQGRRPIPPGYVRTCNLTEELLRKWLEVHSSDPVPRFRFPGRDVAIIGSMRDIGHRLALNDEARELVEIWCALKELDGVDDYPTVMMARAALDAAGVAWETCALADLSIPGGEVKKWR